jgi:predicted nucleotide-binding protein
VQTPKYHIYIEYSEADKSGFRFNITQEELQRTFTLPYIEGKPFWFLGRLLNPIKVTKALIFWSYEKANELDLPTLENLVSAKDKKYMLECVERGKVKGAYLCTEKFLTKPNTVTKPSTGSSSTKRRVLVACGSDEEMKQALTWALGKLWLVPVVLNEEPGHGRKIVERFTDYGDIGLAVVLLSPDDYVYAKSEEATKRKLKPRQDVIFELGFLMGKLGRDRVLVFYKESEKGAFDVNTDFEGIKTIPFDDRDSWRLALIRELTNNGYTVEGDRILK